MPTIVTADDSYSRKVNQFAQQLITYGKIHKSNIEVLTKDEDKKRTEAEEHLYFWTICQTVTNLKRAKQLILDNPEYAQHLEGNVLPNIQEELDFHVHLASMLDGTKNECR